MTASVCRRKCPVDFASSYRKMKRLRSEDDDRMQPSRVKASRKRVSQGMRVAASA
ncbi:hypothetical protein F2Q70_00044863 [Brassica cretica]|uniref:Uncharacterized protein n=2 Tax=Brassica cretica TaxID=69181 RepID=A0A3N6R7L6_BRACR|nr:hypothetical protein F2Q70_00044863 [Brassica cretica]KAF2608210.1 hypothetical protein F2Q68_00045834 [Brassica cretica]KAF3517079.1 hypothetical protein DY000_02062954 [Brassica cretica]